MKKSVGCLLLVFFALALTGCVSSKQKAAQQLSVLEAQCAAQFPLQAGDFTKRAQCRNAAEDATIGPFESDQDLYQGRHAERLILAQEADAAQISLPQAQLEFSQFVSSQIAVAQQRQAVNSEIQSQRMNALSNLIVAERIANPPPPPLPTYVPIVPPPSIPTVITNCNTYGAQTNCTSHP